MTDTASATSSAEAAPKGLVARVFGVFFSPRATYASVAAHPRWLGPLLITCVVLAGGYAILLSTDVGKKAALDQQTQVIESFGVKLNDQAYARLEEGIDRAKYTTPIGQFIGLPIVLAIVSGILLGIFNALLGGDAKFKQVFAILAHSSLITALQTLFVIPIDYMKESMASPTSLLAVMPFLDEGTFFGRLFSTIDLFQLWATLSIAIGLGVLYKRKTTPIAISLYVVMFVILVAIAAVRTALSS
jgi:hypothetical protein